MITPGYAGKQVLIERINDVRYYRQAAVDDDKGKDEVDFGEDVASVAS